MKIKFKDALREQCADPLEDTWTSISRISFCFYNESQGVISIHEE